MRTTPISTKIRAAAYGLAFAALAAAAACSNETSTSLGPTATRCAVTLSVEPNSFTSAGGQGAVSIGTNRECAWEARSEAGWVALRSEATGQGAATLTFGVSANPAVSQRRGAIVVNDQRIEVTQAEAPCVYSLDSGGRAVGAGSTELRVGVTAQSGCAWTAVSQASWIGVASGANGNGNAVVTLRVAENHETSRRVGTVTIAGQPYTVSAGKPVEAEGLREALFVRIVPFEFAYDFADFESSDGFRFTGRVELSISVVPERTELVSFKRELLGSNRVINRDRLRRHCEEAVQTGLVRFVSSRPAEQLVRPDTWNEFDDVLADAFA